MLIFSFFSTAYAQEKWNCVDAYKLTLVGKAFNDTPNPYHRDMTPKTVYYALDGLINHEWKTNLELKPSSAGKITFREFKGTYRISWIDPKGEEHIETLTIK